MSVKLLFSRGEKTMMIAFPDVYVHFRPSWIFFLGHSESHLSHFRRNPQRTEYLWTTINRTLL